MNFSLNGSPVPALKGGSLALQPGETLALVGESGSEHFANWYRDYYRKK